MNELELKYFKSIAISLKGIKESLETISESMLEEIDDFEDLEEPEDVETEENPA